MSHTLQIKAGSRQASASASPPLPPSGETHDVHELSFSDVSFPDTEDEQSHSVPRQAMTSISAIYRSAPSRPLTVAIPDSYHHGSLIASSYKPRRPTLQELLDNAAPPPWTMSAFMAYLSANHCLETLEFVMDSHRYRRHFDKVLMRSGGIEPGSEGAIFMRTLWHKLMQAYILPNGSREVNLPSEVRHELISQDDTVLPPEPNCLNMAVDKVLELMEESLLLPFLNSVSTQSHTAESSTPSSVEDLSITYNVSASYDERGGNTFRTRTRKTMRRRRSPINHSGESLSTSTPASAMQSPLQSPHSHRASAPSAITQFARSISQSARHGFSHNHSHSHSHTNSNHSPSPSRPSSTVAPLPPHPAVPPTPTFLSPGGAFTLSPSTSAEPTSASTTAAHSQHTLRSKQSREMMMDPRHSASVSSSKDTVSTARSSVVAVPLPTSSTAVSASVEPVTPPTTPPTGDIASSSMHGAAGQHGGGSKGSVNPWKRMRYSFGWRRKDHPSQSPP